MVNSEESGKKHPCEDCLCCQWCGDDRCRLCLGAKGRPGRKLSMAEQIALYEALNSDGRDGSDPSG